MKFIPNTYLLENGKEAPEGTVVFTCNKCGAKFAVPENEAGSITNNTLCEACADAVDNAAQVTAEANAMGGSAEAADTINKALGN